MQNKLAAILPICTVLKTANCPIFITRIASNLSHKIIGDIDTSTDPDLSPIIVFHGLLENKKHWEGLSKIMMNTMKRAVVTVDLRNHGDSPHAHPHKYEEMAEDVLKLYEKLDIDKACLIGYNMGGGVSMCFSLIEPKKVVALIVVEISPKSTPTVFTETMPKVLKAMKKVNFKNAKNVRTARKHAKEQLKEIIDDDYFMKVILSNINIKSDNVIGWTCNLNLLIKHFKYISSFPTQDLRGNRYRGPTMFVGGQTSDYIPPDDLTLIRNFFPQAVIQYIPNAGHNLHKDDPKTFMELVIKFLKDTP